MFKVPVVGLLLPDFLVDFNWPSHTGLGGGGHLFSLRPLLYFTSVFKGMEL